MPDESGQQPWTHHASQPAVPRGKPPASAPPLVPLPKPTVADVILTKQANNGGTDTR
jgi:hypothetical protein